MVGTALTTVMRSAPSSAKAAVASNAAMPTNAPPCTNMPSALQTQPAV